MLTKDAVLLVHINLLNRNKYKWRVHVLCLSEQFVHLTLIYFSRHSGSSLKDLQMEMSIYNCRAQLMDPFIGDRRRVCWLDVAVGAFWYLCLQEVCIAPTDIFNYFRKCILLLMCLLPTILGISCTIILIICCSQCIFLCLISFLSCRNLFSASIHILLFFPRSLKLNS